MNDPALQTQIQEQCRAIADSPEEKEAIAWLDALYDESEAAGFLNGGPPQK
jgi:hypothetical protein